MEGQVEITPTVEVAPSVSPTVEPTPTQIPVSLEMGDEIEKGGKFELASYLLMVGFLGASLYSIYYYRQALNKLNEKEDDSILKNEIGEIRYNLKKIMGKKYETKKA
jgi:hypothetical protein